MSAITPQTDLKLLKCPIESDNRNQMTFANATAQRTYFNSLPKLEVYTFTYQRRDGVIRYPAHIDSILQYNYVMYQNDAYTNKYFYAFITKMEYVNDNMTNIYIKEDVYQTWQFDMVWRRSFIEREHVNNDNVGANTVPEGLETGEYVCNSTGRLFAGGATYVCIACSDAPTVIAPRRNRRFNGIFSGCDLYLFDDYQGASNFITAMSADGKMEAIVSVFLVPQSLFTDQTINFKQYTVRAGNINYEFRGAYAPVSDSSIVLNTSSSFTVPNTLDGYTPVNNKLKVYPYSYFYISNNAGSDVPYKYEEFVDNTASFKTIGSLTPSCSIRCIPLNYKKLEDTATSNYSFNSGVTVAKFPICSWSNDTYLNWLTQNSVNYAFNMVSGVGTALVGGVMLATGVGALAGAGAMVGGIATIANTLKEQYNHSLMPDQGQGNINSGDVQFSSGKVEVRVYKMSIRNEFAKIIDGFFSMYGYKINRVAIPHITGRRNWNYVKTIGANIQGDIPEDSLNEIKQLFDNGITLWHNPSTYLDYSQNNDII